MMFNNNLQILTLYNSRSFIVKNHNKFSFKENNPKLCDFFFGKMKSIKNFFAVISRIVIVNPEI